MKSLLFAGLALAWLLVAAPREASAQAQVVGGVGQAGACPTTGTQVNPVFGAPVLINQQGQLCVAIASGGSSGGSTSNAGSGVATSSTNGPVVAYNYGFNGTTWDQLQVDGSKSLKMNCVTGCAGGTTSNATSAVATSSANGASVSYGYAFNGTSWDQLQDDASKNLKVVDSASVAQASTTSGQSGALVQCATTTAAPTYVTAKTNPLSCNTAGQVAVADPTVVSAINAAALTVPLAITGSTTTTAQVTITTGGTAQNLFSAVQPTNGYEVCNPNATEDAWLSETTTAVANAGFRVPANGGCYDSPVGSKPSGVVSVIAATTAHKLTVKNW